jgi:glycosyltransferase involved in cell wall biosynthesis
MWRGKTVSVALPTYNERASIRECIEQFFATGFVDEVVVCNNNAAPGTSEEVAKTPAREVFESRQGYGWSCRKAMAETTGDLVILAEPDGSFDPRDILKLLAYADDFDVVFGSRTNRELIWSGANMGFFMKWANWLVAKYLEVLFNATTLSDVGCTMRLIHRPVLERIQPFFRVGGSHFSPEMMVLCILSGARVIQIPVNYRQRIGQSMVCGNRWVAARLGLQMTLLITRLRLESWLIGHPLRAAAWAPADRRRS